MADGKLDLPDDLLSSKPSDQSAWITKVEASGGNDEEKVFMGSLDESKDQMAAESSIPLPPQWLYSEPSDAKMEFRAPNSLSTGNSTDSNLKEGWRLEGSEDKKDRRTVASDFDSSRRKTNLTLGFIQRFREQKNTLGFKQRLREQKNTKKNLTLGFQDGRFNSSFSSQIII